MLRAAAQSAHIVAITRILRLHLGHASTSNPNVLFIITAHSRRLDHANSAPSSRRAGCTMGDSVGYTACPDVYSAFLGCTDQHAASQCDGSSTCSAEQQAFQVCVTKECAADPSKCGQ